MKRTVCTATTIFAMLLMIQACQKKQSGEAPPVSTSTELSSTSAPMACSDGKAPVILEGAECPGQWILTQEKGTSKNLCTFNYGPAIRCPAGTRSTSYEAVCYGQITKTDFYPDSVLECAKKLGASPQKSPYKLTCCPQ